MRPRRQAGKAFSLFVLAASALAATPPARPADTPPLEGKERQVAAARRSWAHGDLMHAAAVACHGLAARDVFCQPLAETRRQLLPGVGYYTLEVKVGSGEYDIVTLHRVVRETRPGHPGIAGRAVFMIHGDILGFEPAFLGPTLFREPAQPSLPAFLARNGVDVWGISYRWARIPVGLPDTSFMAGWGMDVAVSDARVGLRITRVARRLGGQGLRRIHVLGWSRGVWTTMALANAEATEPAAQRDIAGLIPVDGSFKSDPANEAFRQDTCADYIGLQDMLAAGAFGVDRSFFPSFAQLALDSPEDPSPYFAAFTNAQFAIGMAAWPRGVPGMEWYHFNAGTFEGDVPTGMVYAEPTLSFVTFSKVYGFDPTLYLSDAVGLTCDEVDLPWDDHVADVRVPLFYVGAGGGFGTVGEYLTEIVGSCDATSLVVRERPPEEAALDIGHADIFQAPAARALFWEPILAWIRRH